MPPTATEVIQRMDTIPAPPPVHREHDPWSDTMRQFPIAAIVPDDEIVQALE